MSSPRVVKIVASQYRTKIHAPTARQISCGFSPASVNAADFPFDCNRTAIAPLPLQAKAVCNERHVQSTNIPSRSITSSIRLDIYYIAVRVAIDVESFLLLSRCTKSQEQDLWFDSPNRRVELGNSGFPRVSEIIFKEIISSLEIFWDKQNVYWREVRVWN